MSTNGMPWTPSELPREVALALLERSIEYGHGALAVARLALAVKCGAAVSDRHWEFCRKVMAGCHDLELEGLMSAAARLASGPGPSLSAG